MPNRFEEARKEKIEFYADKISKLTETRLEENINTATELVDLNRRIALPEKTRIRIFERDRNTCRYCGNTYQRTELHIDHICPVSRGGKNEDSNLVTACRQCNIQKNNLNDYEFISFRAISKNFKKMFPQAKEVRVKNNLKEVIVIFETKKFVEEYSKWEYQTNENVHKTANSIS